MKTVRLETTEFGQTSFVKEGVNKLLEFDNDTGILRVYVLKESRFVSFGNYEEEICLVKEILKKDFLPEEIKIIHNQPVIGAYSAPFKIYLDINTDCSLSCPFCLSDSGGNSQSRLSLDTIKELAKEANNLGVMYVKVGGGDPLLHPDFFAIITELREAGLFVSLSVNSVKMNSEIALFLAKNKVRVSVSIDGTQETNDFLRGKKHFTKAVKAAETLKEFGADVIFRTTLLKVNLSEIPDLIKVAEKMGLKIKFSYCRSAGRAVKNKLMLTPDDYDSYFRVLQLVNNQEYSPNVLIDEGMMFSHDNEIKAKLFCDCMCGAANRSMHINANGAVSPCVFLGPQFSSGEILKDGNVLDFWNETVGVNFRIIRDITWPEECSNCERLCKNECPANRMYFFGDFIGQDPNCLNEVCRKCK